MKSLLVNLFFRVRELNSILVWAQGWNGEMYKFNQLHVNAYTHRSLVTRELTPHSGQTMHFLYSILPYRESSHDNPFICNNKQHVIQVPCSQYLCNFTQLYIGASAVYIVILTKWDAAIAPWVILINNMLQSHVQFRHLHCVNDGMVSGCVLCELGHQMRNTQFWSVSKSSAAAVRCARDVHLRAL